MIAYRIVAVLVLMAVFFLLTSLAHRTDPRALQSKLWGLAFVALALGFIGFISTPSAQTISLFAHFITLLGLALASYVYASQAINTDSAIRWGAPVATLIALAISLAVDLFTERHTSDWTLAFTISMFSATFFGHLLRARRNKVLLHANQREHQKSLFEQTREEEIRADERLRLSRCLQEDWGDRLAQLLSMSEKGECSPIQMHTALQHCADELHLALQTNGVAREDFSAALTELRQHYEHRLRQVGVELKTWETTSLPKPLRVPTVDIAALLRIVHQTVELFIEPSSAQCLDVAFEYEHNTLAILFKAHELHEHSMNLSGFQKQVYALGADLVEIDQHSNTISIDIRYRHNALTV